MRFTHDPYTTHTNGYGVCVTRRPTCSVCVRAPVGGERSTPPKTSSSSRAYRRPPGGSARGGCARNKRRTGAAARAKESNTLGVKTVCCAPSFPFPPGRRRTRPARQPLSRARLTRPIRNPYLIILFYYPHTHLPGADSKPRGVRFQRRFVSFSGVRTLSKIPSSNRPAGRCDPYDDDDR